MHLELETANDKEAFPEKENGDDVLPQEKSPNIDAFEPEVIERAIKISRTMVGMSLTSGSPWAGIFDKFNSNHLDKLLDGLEKDSDHEYELKKPIKFTH